MSKYKLVVMDLDDTLLNSELKISQYTQKVIQNAQRQGIKIVIASGRPTAAIMPYTQELELKKNAGYVISYNGAVLTDCATQREIHRVPLTFKDMDKLCALAKELNTHAHSYMGDNILTDESNEWTDFESKLTGMPVVKVANLRAALTQEVVKILFVNDPVIVKKHEAQLRSELHKVVSMNISKPFFLEFTNIAVDKSKTIQVLAKKLGIQREEIMAVGDSYNDQTMIEYAGMGIAMNNAPDDIKNKADFITHCNDTDGVATAINRFVLNV
jgi:Cof subfamily protein (haloacid dehalogenase superfamily)